MAVTCLFFPLASVKMMLFWSWQAHAAHYTACSCHSMAAPSPFGWYRKVSRQKISAKSTSALLVRVILTNVPSCSSLQDHTPSSPLSATTEQQPPVGLAGEAVPSQVWQLCGVPANLQATNLVSTADALLQLDSVQCPLEVVTCLQHADQAITQAVSHIRSKSCQNHMAASFTHSFRFRCWCCDCMIAWNRSCCVY